MWSECIILSMFSIWCNMQHANIYFPKWLLPSDINTLFIYLSVSIDVWEECQLKGLFFQRLNCCILMSGSRCLAMNLLKHTEARSRSGAQMHEWIWIIYVSCTWSKLFFFCVLISYPPWQKHVGCINERLAISLIPIIYLTWICVGFFVEYAAYCRWNINVMINVRGHHFRLALWYHR